MTSRSRTIAIIGAGFSGTALAYRLLRSTHPAPTRIVLIERGNRFGPGLAYSERAAGTTLNVPAARMSIDETRPDDLLDYLHSRSMPVAPEEFVPRTLYGEYLEARLRDAAREAPPRTQLIRVNRIAIGVSRPDVKSYWSVAFDDGSSMLSDVVILATGHCAPRSLPAFDAIAGAGVYENDPWKPSISSARPARVLLIGTGLTMADVACRLACRAYPPREIVALSRRGLLPRHRHPLALHAPDAPLGFELLQRAGTLRAMMAEVRSLVRRAAEHGVDWRDVMVELRAQAPLLWRKLSAADKSRFLRHVQPYWDVHRHQLPLFVGKTIEELVKSKRLRVRAGRVDGVRLVNGRAEVTLRPRHKAATETQLFDLVVNCSGPDGDPGRAHTRLMRMLVANGLLVPCSSGTGLQVDPIGRPLDRRGSPTPGLYYLGPWLKARDLEATAVQELRAHATALTGRLLTKPRPAPGFFRRLLGPRRQGGAAQEPPVAARLVGTCPR